MNVIINNLNLADEFGITVTDIAISSPEPVIETVSVPGRNGYIDYSKAITGFITYNNRKIEIKAFVRETFEEYLTRYSRIISLIGNDIVDIVTESGYVWKGRPYVEYEKTDAILSEITIECDVFPYKRKVEDTVISKAVNEMESITCRNLAEPVVPEITVSNSMKIKFEDKVFSIDKGTHKLDLVFKQGNNTIIAEGSGNINIKYREGCL